MERETHDILGGRAYVFKRDDSKYWYAAAFVNGQNHRHSTKLTDLKPAIHDAEEWYLDLRGKISVGVLTPSGEPKTEPTFREEAQRFLMEYTRLTEGQRSPRWVRGHEIRLRVHLLPFFGDLSISKVNSAKIQEYRVMRMTPCETKNPHALDNRKTQPRVPAEKTLHNEIVTLRLVLKNAQRHRSIESLPDLSKPFRRNSKVSHRPWFSPAEYKQLYTATRNYADKALPHVTWSAEQLHDYVLFMANTGLRPDEAKNLQHRDIEIVFDEDTNETILVIEVRGKRGTGYCKSTANAVRPYERLLARKKPATLIEPGKPEYPQPTDPVFPTSYVKILSNLLERENLKYDRDDNKRTAYSLRHTYICLRLMEGADVYQLAKNCRTSVDMIEQHYAAHIKNMLDAGLINVRRIRKPKNPVLPDEEQ